MSTRRSKYSGITGLALVAGLLASALQVSGQPQPANVTAAATKGNSPVIGNVTPTLTLDPVAPIYENGVATLTGTITDAGTLDPFTLHINWGDPLSPSNTQQFAFGAGATVTQPFSIVHQYLDDNPSATTQDTYTITVTVIDDNGIGGPFKSSGASATTTVVVRDVAPRLTLGPVPTIGENGVATLFGWISDPGTLDTFTLDIDWGDPLSPANTQTVTLGASASGLQMFMVAHQYLDDNPTATPEDSYTIGVTVTDDDLLSDSKSATVLVKNLVPNITSFMVPPRILHDETASLTATAADVGTLDALTFTWTIAQPGSTSIVTTLVGPSHTFAPPPLEGDYRVDLVVEDDDLGRAVTSAVMTVATGILQPNEPGSLLVHPLIDNTGSRRTVIGISNEDVGDVWLQGFMIVRGPGKGVDVFVKKDFYIHLTSGEPFYWDTSKPYSRRDVDGVMNQIQGFDNHIGFCFVWAIDGLDTKLEIAWDYLRGEGMLIDGARAFQYNAIPHQAFEILPDRVLNLDGWEYLRAPSEIASEGFVQGIVDGGVLAVCSPDIDFVRSIQPGFDINVDVWNQDETAQSRHLDFYQFEAYDLSRDLQLGRDEIFTAKWQLRMTATDPIWAVYLQYKGDRAMAQNVWQQRFSARNAKVILPPVPR